MPPKSARRRGSFGAVTELGRRSPCPIPPHRLALPDRRRHQLRRPRLVRRLPLLVPHAASRHTDAIHAACCGLTSCLRDNATVGSGSGSRIDYLFAANVSGPARVGSGHTLTFAEADRLARRDTGRDDASLSYSDHKAVTAKVYH